MLGGLCIAGEMLVYDWRDKLRRNDEGHKKKGKEGAL